MDYIAKAVAENQKGIEALMHLINFESKNELKKYTRTLSVSLKEFAAFLHCARAGVFDPYLYRPIFRWIDPPHLVVTKEERDEFLRALSSSKRGDRLEGVALKVHQKDMQIGEERKITAGHLLFTSSQEYWQAFYFNQKDLKKNENHWEGGPHIHFINYLWSNITLENVAETISRGGKDLPKPLHIRFSP